MKAHKAPKHPPTSLYGVIVRNQIKQALPKVRYEITDTPVSTPAKLSTMGNIHDEDEYTIIDVHCDLASFGLPEKFVKQVSPQLLRHKVGKFLNVWGVSWAGSLDCYSFRINESFINKWWYQRIVALAPKRSQTQLQNDLRKGPPKIDSKQ